MATRFDPSKNQCRVDQSSPGQPQLQSPTSKRPTHSGGYECELIECPPKYLLQSECPVCLLVLREPYQVTCCGYSFCRTCTKQVQATNKGCPTCNQKEFSVFPNKGLQRSLYSLHVRCPYKKEGCKWTGALGGLDKHLNENPKANEQLVGCEFAEVGCIHCGNPFQRRLVTTHQSESCLKRPFSCEYCSEYKSTYEDVVAHHWPVCKYYLVPCPHKCGVHTKRQHLDHHVNKECPLKLVNCDFHYAGCEVRLPRKDMPSHLAEGLVTHMSLMAAHSRRMVAEKEELNEWIGKLQDELKQKMWESEQTFEDNRQRIDELERENETLRKQLTQLSISTEVRSDAMKEEMVDLKMEQGSLRSHIGLLPINLRMAGFDHIKSCGYEWFSSSFYTHPKGYKMCLRVDMWGHNPTHVSVYVHLMPGEFDNYLQWPFRGSIAVQLMNQLEDKEHIECVIPFTDSTPIDCSGRVTKKAITPFGWGNPDMATDTELTFNGANNRQHLKDDCLDFRVSRVMAYVSQSAPFEKQCHAIESRIPVPPFEFTMDEFEKHKTDQNCFSLPFYFHMKGYRMCINVYANGDGDGKNTHLSVTVSLLCGHFDNELWWPFRGYITIQLLNQLKDEEHHTEKIHFNYDIPHCTVDKVTANERIHEQGLPRFLPHTELTLNPAKNRQYLKNDCLHFQVPLNGTARIPC